MFRDRKVLKIQGVMIEYDLATPPATLPTMARRRSIGRPARGAAGR